MIEVSYRVLVVDDEPETARLVRHWYAGRPVSVLEAMDGEEGLRQALGGKPDVILLDLRMPGLSGLEVARRLKADPLTRDVPVIVLSACRDLGDKVEALNAGADDYVTKPFEFPEIDARIAGMLRKRREVLGLRTENRELEGLVGVDEKTGLHNFREFQQKLREEWLRAERYGTSLSLIMLDLDDFKRLNDTLGHPSGDVALREFATLVAGGARASDLAARYGGEEFVMILPHTGGAMAARVAERIRIATREFVFLREEHPTRVTVSAGVATHPSHPEIDSMQALLRAADRALYRAKQEGKDRVVVDERPRPTDVPLHLP